MDIATHLHTLRIDGELLALAAERTGLDAHVPTCPDWLMRDLVGHLGGVHRWATFILESGRAERPGREDAAALFVTPGDGELLDWYRSGHEALLKAIAGGSPQATTWTFFDAPSPLAFWARRQAHETAVHRVDAERVAGTMSPIAADFAADGIDELLVGFLSRTRGTLVSDPPISIAITPDDDAAAWTMHVSADARRVVPQAHPADVTVSGPAAELYLLLWNRVDTTHCHIQGNPEILGLWRDLARATL